jgi:glycosyltransferase involved in cell wall biosynthesis
MKISIITATYNSGRTVRDTIESVLRQTYTDFEYIIKDGGSKDDTLAIVKEYAPQFGDRLKIVSAPDKGIYDAMNKGIALSTGEWINFMNAGDVFVNDTVVEDVFSHAIQKNVGLIYGNVLVNYPGNEGGVKLLDNLKEGQIQFSLNHQSTFTKGDFLREVGYDISYKLAADANSFNEIYKTTS